MTQLLDDLDLLLSQAPDDVQDVHERVANKHDRFRALWVQLAGGAVEQTMLADLGEIIQPGHRVLDAGAGTGALSRRIRAMEPEAALTLLDLSPAMLSHAADIPGDRIEGSVLDLPQASPEEGGSSAARVNLTPHSARADAVNRTRRAHTSDVSRFSGG